MHTLDHPNLVKLLGLAYSELYGYIVPSCIIMPLAEHGTLDAFLEESPDTEQPA